jgi:tetratricopeptide (TPR) repeat protein
MNFPTFSPAMKWRTLAMQTLGLAIFSTAMGAAQARQCPLVPSDRAEMYQTEAGDLLRDGKYPEFEARLEKIHRKNMSSDGEDLLTMRDMGAILTMAGQGHTSTILHMWIDARPNSFFAQWAMGMSYIDQATSISGGRPLSRVSKGELSKMHQLYGTAIGYLQKAMQIDPHSALPQSMMLVIAGNEGQAAGKTAEQWLQAANEADPKNLSARIQAVRFFSPRWGGSFELLDKMAQQAEKSLPSDAAYYLRYNVVIEKASHEEVIDRNKAKANELYKQAKSMCENSSSAQDGIIRTYQ